MKPNEKHPTAASANSPIAAAASFIINVILFPLTLVGYIIYVVWLYAAGRTPGVSMTAQGPLSARFTEHELGVREDEAAKRLMTAMPGNPPLALFYLFGTSMLLGHHLTGYVPRAFRYPFEGEVAPQYEASARQAFFDRVVERHLGDITQLVILGAGFDTRAYRLPREERGRWFEVDRPETQAVKRQLLQQTGIDTTGVTFVSADFEEGDWLKKLTAAGFDRAKPALFLLEGVILYLDRSAVEDTFRKIASTARGSLVAFDYFTTEPITSRGLYWSFGRAATRAAGEPMKFGIDSTPPSRDRLAEFLRTCGLLLEEQRTLGQETNGKRAWGGFATASVQ